MTKGGIWTGRNACATIDGEEAYCSAMITRISVSGMVRNTLAMKKSQASVLWNSYLCVRPFRDKRTCRL
jgi:hypothetical protein